MDYQKIYDSIVNRAILRNWISPKKKYKIGINPTDFTVEVHHIIPKCLGGNDKLSNLVVLNLKEHFL
jgi:5-methylcytosine-specific restriction endonuclease McrA